jgi:hypothetical protein
VRVRYSLALIPVLVAAGCGSKSPSVANVATTTTTASRTSQTGAVAFAACMRSHGVPNWPDPMANGGFDKERLRALGLGQTQMQRLQRPCEHLLPDFNHPNGRSEQQQNRLRVADALSFARCMRHHGVRNFPDPSAQDGLTVGMVQAQGIDVHSAAFLHVVDACIPASHGGLTAAKVREAIQNAGH